MSRADYHAAADRCRRARPGIQNMQMRAVLTPHFSCLADSCSPTIPPRIICRHIVCPHGVCRRTGDISYLKGAGRYYFTNAFCRVHVLLRGPADARIQLRLTVEETIVPGPTGAGEFLAQYAPGVAWHRGRQSFVIWAGGQNPLPLQSGDESLHPGGTRRR